jgi:hypothetical protein
VEAQRERGKVKGRESVNVLKINHCSFFFSSLSVTRTNSRGGEGGELRREREQGNEGMRETKREREQGNGGN